MRVGMFSQLHAATVASDTNTLPSLQAGRPASDEDVDAEFAKLDKNKDGKISPSEFLFKGWSILGGGSTPPATTDASASSSGIASPTTEATTKAPPATPAAATAAVAATAASAVSKAPAPAPATPVAPAAATVPAADAAEAEASGGSSIDLLFLALGLVAGAGGMSAYQVYPFTQPATSTGMAGMRCYSRFTARHTIGGAKGGLMPSSGAKADKSLMRRLMLAR